MDDKRFEELMARRTKDEENSDLFWIVFGILMAGLIAFTAVGMKLLDIIGV